MKKTLKKFGAVLLALAMLVGMIPMAVTATEYPTIALDQEMTVILDGSAVIDVIYKFVPETDGTYVFWSYNNNYDTYGYLLDSNMEELTHNDDGGEGTNFRVDCTMTAGTTYYLKSRFFTESNSGSFKVKIAKSVPATSLSITSEAEITVNAGFWDELYYEFAPGNYIDEEVTFASDNTSVVSMDSNRFYAHKAGTANITATSENGLTDSVTITVVDTPVMELNTEYTVYGDGTNKYYKFTPAEDGIYGFYSYNNGGSNVDLLLTGYADDHVWENGYTTNNGNKRIQYELTGGKSYLLHVYSGNTFDVMAEKLVPATSVTLVADSCTGTFGTTITPRVYFLSSNVIEESYTFSVADEGFAVVNDDGTVSLLKVGTTEITVTTENGLTDTCTLTVEDYENILLEKLSFFIPTVNTSSKYYRFVPSEDGTYSFASLRNFDTYGCLYDSNGDIVAENDNFSNHNFYFTCDLTAGEVYVLCVKVHSVSSSNTADVGVQVNMLDENGNVVHDIAEYTYTESEHSGFCSRCEMDIVTSHNLDADGLCFCGYKHEHELECTYREDTHDSYCGSCDTWFTEIEHSFTDGVCVCGYTDHEHKFKWYDLSGSDDTIHMSDCVICMLYVEEAHDFGDGNVCADCGYEFHEHVMGDDRYIYETYHDGYCDICDLYMYGDHEFGEDGVCVCGYADHEHTGDFIYVYNDYHMLNCGICEFTGISEDHVLDDEGKCKCGFVNHTHDFTDYYYENEGHCFKCSSCTALDDYVYSHYDEGEGKCECGYEFRANVLIGGTELTDGQYLSTDGKVSDTEPEEWNAHFADGVLTLGDLILEVTDEDLYAIWGNDDLKIIVNGTVILSTVGEDVIHLDSGNLTISGDGTMYVTAYGDYDGIDAASNGDVTIDGPTIYIESGDHGIEAEERFTMESGTVVISAGDDGVDAEDNTINGGVMIIHAEDIGIDADDNTTVNGGYINIVTNDEDGFEADGYIKVNGGYIVIDADEYGFNSYDGNVAINGGDIYIESGEGAIAAYDSIYVAEDMGTFETVYDEYDGYYYLAEDGEVLYSAHLTAEDNTTVIKSDWITLSADSAEYTGEDLLPEITVTNDDGNVLKEGTDYTVTWSADEAVMPGVYYATIEGIGDYSGTQYLIFTVKHTYVYVGGVTVYNGEYLANGATETTMEKPDGGYAYFADGVLTLNNFKYEGEGYWYDPELGYSAVIYGENDLVIEVIGTNVITNTENKCDGITANSNITLAGNGTLTINSDFGIYCYGTEVNVNECNLILNSARRGIYSYGDITINSGSVQINATNGLYCYREINLNGGITVIDAERYGIEAEIAINVNGGYTEITAGRIAAQADSFSFADGMAMALPENSEIKYINNNCYTYVDGEVAGSAIFTADAENMLYGDANIDGKVNLADVSLMLKYIAGWDVTLDKIAADVNVDGKVNLTDASLILKFIALWDVTLGK